MNYNDLEVMGKKSGWELLERQESIGLISFSKTINAHPARINIYTTKMTVATCINHPKKGKTQMFRKKVSPDLMEKLFNNPRTHTNKGYRKK